MRASLKLSLLLLCIPVGLSLNARPAGELRWAYVQPDSLKRTSPLPGGRFDVLAILGTTLRGDGSVHGMPIHASQASAIVYPVVSFANAREGRQLLRSTQARNQAIQELRRLARQGPYRGLHLDLEYLNGEDASFLAQFLGELYPLMKEDGRRLTLAIFPPNFPARYAAFHDPGRIGGLADEFVLMTYDLHRPSTSPGPVTDLRWAEEGIRLAMKHIAADRLWLGVPAYGYEWSLPSRRYRTLMASSFRQLLARSRGDLIRRDPSGCLLVSRSLPEGGRTIAYFPDLEMRKNLEDLATRFALRGTALWRPEFDG